MKNLTTEETLEYGWVIATGYAQFIDKPITLLSYGHLLLTKEQLITTYPNLQINSVSEITQFIKEVQRSIKRLRMSSLLVRQLDSALKPHLQRIKVACSMENSERVFKLRAFMTAFYPDELDSNATLGVWSWLGDNVVLHWDARNEKHLEINTKVVTLLTTISDKEAFKESIKQIFPNTYTDDWFEECYLRQVNKTKLTA